jgi:probable DNA metabolism protein
MNRYLYDGSTDGLLSAIAYILENDPIPESAVLTEKGRTLFEDGLFIATDALSAETLFTRLYQRAPQAAHTVYDCILAEKVGAETNLLRYLALCFAMGDKVDGHLNHPAVREMVAISKKVARELHKMKGLLRFEELADGTYLGKMEPDHNILHPLALHFTNRLRGQTWFIYDVKRGTVANWDKDELQVFAVEAFQNPALSENEKKIQALWRTFFDTIAISSRKNPSLQKSNMPMKYWKYLTEKQRSTSGKHR